MIQLSDKPVIVQGNTLMEQEEAAARGIDCAAARQNTLAWNILAAHNTAAGDDPPCACVLTPWPRTTSPMWASSSRPGPPA